MAFKKKLDSVSKNSAPLSDRIPPFEKLSYGIGALMDGGGVALMACVILKYMTSLGIAAAVASTIMMVSEIWDAVSNPLMGHISDNTRSRFGRRKPYMFIGGILAIAGLLLLFMPVRDWGMSVAGFTAYMFVMYILWNTFSAVSQVPYCSLSGDISPSYKERNSANTVKLVFGALASGLAYVLPLVFLELYTNYSPDSLYAKLFNSGEITGVQFWLLISLIFGGLFGGGLILAALVVKERAQPAPRVKKPRLTFKQFAASYAIPFRNKSFRIHIIMYATAFMCMDMISALAVYYATDVWHGYKLFGMDFSSLFIIAPLMVAAVVAFPLVRYIMDKKSKQFAFRMGLPFYIAGGIMLAVFDPAWCPPILVPLAALFMGLGFGGAQMMPWIIFPDVVDVGEMATGDRPTGSYSGMMTFVRKLAGALGVGLVGWILEAGGYLSSEQASDYIIQSPKTLLTIRLLMGLSIAFLISFALAASFRFKVTDRKLDRVRFFIDAAKSGTELSESEAGEKENLIAELHGKNTKNQNTAQGITDK